MEASRVREDDPTPAKPNRAQRRHPVFPFWLKTTNLDDEEWLRKKRGIRKRKKKFLKKQRRLNHGHKAKKA